MVNGTQMTVTWHVNDIKLLQKNGMEIPKLLRFLGEWYWDKIMRDY